MQRLLAKTLTSTAFVLVTFTAAQADNQSPFPSASEEYPRSFPPALLQYFEKREANIAKEVRGDAKDRTRDPLRPSYLPWAPRVFTPEQLQYWAGRDAALAKELKDKPMKETAIHWLQRQPQSID